jgi:transcription elongation factor GreA
MTPEGRVQLEAELKHLKEVVRMQVVRDIEEARAHGDISENAEYDAAKDRQGHVEGRIIELESKVAAAEVIDVTKLPRNGRVVFGVTVELEDQDSGETLTYRIVGQDEADVRAGRISITSPIARALVGKSEGDEVKVDVPGGRRYLAINQVRYE